MITTKDLTDRMYAAFGYVPSGTPREAAVAANVAAARAIAGISATETNKQYRSAAEKNISQYAVTRNDVHFADLTLKHGTEIYKFANSILTENTPGILAPTPTLGFKRAKNIVKTAVDGSDSEVIESFGCKSWEITISGILIDLDNHVYPSEKIRQLRELFEINDTLDVLDCRLLEDLGIQSIYLEKTEKFDLLKDFSDTISYEFKAASIKPLEFFV
ncbi:MAG: hypothetical protein IK032_07655 [Bacteroidales bacterium]|nr:hypothetical protein [Bacteroidales bacterium]MBR5028266.1 hypothetical protein [Bacteroidales bacterium]